MSKSTTEERTEAPTRKRLQELKRKNTVLRSPELVTSVGLIVLVAITPWLVLRVIMGCADVMVVSFRRAGDLDVISAEALLMDSLEIAFYAAGLPILVVLLGVLVAGLAVSRGRPNPYAVKPRFDLLNPKLGVKRIFGVQGLLEAGKGLVKLAAVAVAAWTVLPLAFWTLLEGPPSVGDFLAELASFSMALLWRVAAVAAVVGIFDLWVSRKRYLKQARMTKTELRREFKSNEGDPMIKAARRQRQMALSRNRMLTDVLGSTVVITNPTHIAVALRYKPGDPAPLVVAKGQGLIAQRIKAKAAEAGVPVQENKPLARSLYRSCRIGDSIPIELYEAVAAVLAVVMRKERRRR